MARSKMAGSDRASVRLAKAVLFCAACIGVNVVLSRIVNSLGLPLYLDSEGTILASMLGGYVPGVLVGYFTNIINNLFDGSSIYYSFTNVFIAAAAAFFANRGWFKSPAKVVLAILAFAFIGGGFGSVFTWCFYGFTFGEGTSSALVNILYQTKLFSPMAAQLCGDFIVDIPDKAISVAMAMIAARALSSKGIVQIGFQLWLQKPLSNDEIANLNRIKPRLLSLRTKIAAIVSAIMILAVVVTTCISYVMFNDSMVNEQVAHARGINELAIRQIDPNRVQSFLSEGEAAEGFAQTEAALAQIRDTFPEVQYIYAYRIEPDGCHVVLDPDTADEPGSDPGDVVEFDQAFMPYLDALLTGGSIDPVISNETYGWLLTVYTPLYGKSGNCLCYVATDILMDDIVLDSYTFIAQIIALFGAFFVLICTLVLWIAEYGIIFPLNSIANESSGFAFGDNDDREQTIVRVESLNIHTGDEIEHLYNAINRTTHDTMRFVAESEEKTRTISRMQNNLIMVMADTVEGRDEYTGDHIQRIAAYVRITMDEMLQEGAYCDQLNEVFVQDVGNSAPLHDIGKILVSDTILNKPGRLTEEEFAIIKTHTTAGREILERAVTAVSEPTYLDEAKLIAEFHHEKWDGTGYPSGLAGTNIPLSARIMAVADVFDALVSKRSYKEAYPLDKAFAIIEEGIGTHFDPLVAQAFLNARDEIARVVQEHGDDSAKSR